MLEPLLEHKADPQIQEMYWEAALYRTVGAGEELIVRLFWIEKPSQARQMALNMPPYSISGPTHRSQG